MKVQNSHSRRQRFFSQSRNRKIEFFEDLQFKFKAVNGAELIGKLELNHNIDVILMDIQMPEMNGIVATELVKQRYPQIKIIMLTVFDDDENIFKAIQAGADGYLLRKLTPITCTVPFWNLFKEAPL